MLVAFIVDLGKLSTLPEITFTGADAGDDTVQVVIGTFVTSKTFRDISLKA